MAYYNQPQQPAYGGSNANAAQNLQFFPSSYPNQPVSGHTTPFQAAYNGGAQSYGGGGGFGGSGFAASPGVSGRMGEQGGLRTGWLAAFGTEGYDGEPPLLEELGVNFGHIKVKVGQTQTLTVQNDGMGKTDISLTQTLTVLNPMARMDQHIMDDSDLAGPILFFLLFGTFLLLVSRSRPRRILRIMLTIMTVWQAPLRLHLRSGCFG